MVTTIRTVQVADISERPGGPRGTADPGHQQKGTQPELRAGGWIHDIAA